VAYLQHICDKLLASELKALRAVSIEGAEWCGKTSTAQQAARSSLYMQDPDKTSSYLAAADTKPSFNSVYITFESRFHCVLWGMRIENE